MASATTGRAVASTTSSTCSCPTNIFSGITANETAQALFLLGTQVCVLLVAVHLVRMFLKLVRLPQYMAELIAAGLIGPSGLGQICWVKAALFSPASIRALTGFSSGGGLYIAFAIGLEMDPSLIWSSGRRARLTVFSGLAISTVLGLSTSNLLCEMLGMQTNCGHLRLMMPLLIALTGSPAMIRHATEMKLGTTEVGQLGCSVALLNDVSCLTVMSMVSLSPVFYKTSFKGNLLESLVAIAYPLVAYLLVRPCVRLVMHDKQSHMQLIVVMAMVVACTAMGEAVGYNGLVASFIFGILVPREGGVATALLDRLFFPVRYIALPMYFTFAGQLVNHRVNWDGGTKGPASMVPIQAVLLVAVLCMTSKLSISVAMAWLYKTPLHEGLILGFLLNARGFPDLIFIVTGEEHHMLDIRVQSLVMSSSVLNSIFAALAVLAIMTVTKRPKVVAYSHPKITRQRHTQQMRLLVCLHNIIDMTGTINLIEAFRCSGASPIAIYTVHLIEYNERTAAQLLYRRDITYTLVGGEAKKIAAAIQAYVFEAGISLQHCTAVSFFFNMHEDICHIAEDMDATFIILPFHMFQRFDGRMQLRHSDLRWLNKRMIHNAPCPVGILVDRGLGGTTLRSATHMSHNVIALFFGGPSDREALKLVSRMVEHPGISFTLLRFLPSSMSDSPESTRPSNTSENAVIPKIPQATSIGSNTVFISFGMKEEALDEKSLEKFRRMFVYTGIASYKEMPMKMGQEMVATLEALDAESTLFIVGGGEPQADVGLSGWAECPELGPIGDLLASSDFTITSSVLIISKCFPGQRNSC
ncbi:cation/H(+) antiporter 15 [Amborella trichopoda]|uniref:cation/H(+) antiporter 15 n=1 Tax=Amborella trichopoda TaxID=13333 RepID=UPI0009BCAEBE|nr:cation/H(+) antiporter 15 [Amborella trichopoda]|eukprot:XP_020532069.1 cation/H(+) antiporter 15 [Amborella trichopoda]